VEEEGVVGVRAVVIEVGHDSESSHV